MGYIAHLPKSLIRHLRSSSSLSDIAQAVEELICNSLDAGAKKICVYVDLASFYIKTEDDGSGVTRDDLLLIGERHATSKLHDMVDLESGVPTLGFRGEALSSLSDMGILEIVTRVRGSPNTYKKILKGSKKLSLGLYGEQRNPGTTVVLRELFYNLPVRRKVIQSSPRKVLQGVKDRTVRLALIHPDVSFTVIDLERQENLVCTKSCSSSLETLCDFFGEHLRHELRELCYVKNSLKVEGFISRETSQFSSKAIQFMYFNGRFVQKTPVHKLINTLFLHGNCAHGLRNNPEAGMASAASKQVYPVFLLNLQCPLSWYDITFEPAKTLVEFKDWKSVLSFITEALQTSWSRLTQNLEEGAEGYLTKSEVMEFEKLTPRRKRSSWQHVDPTYRPRCSIDLPKGKDESSCLVGWLQNTQKNISGGEMGQDLTFNTPKGTRTPRKRRAYGSIPEDVIENDSLTGSWSLQPCSTRRKVETDAIADKNQCILQGRDDLWCEEERPLGERSGAFGLHNDVLEGVVGSERQVGVSGEDLLCQDRSSLTFADFPRFTTTNPSVDLNALDSYARLRDLSFDGQAGQLDFKHVIKKEDEYLLGFSEGTSAMAKFTPTPPSYARLRDLSFDGQAGQLAFEHSTKKDRYFLGFSEATSAMAEFTPTPPHLRRSSSVCSPRVRRCLYDLNLKSSYTNDFLCHSERQMVSNLETKSASKEGFWTPMIDAAIDFPAHGFYKGVQGEFEKEGNQDDMHMLSLKNIDSLLDCKSSLFCQEAIFESLPTPSLNTCCILDKGGRISQQKPLKHCVVKDLEERPRGEKADAFCLLPTPSTHLVKKEVVSTKGGKACRQQILKQTEVEESFRGPPNRLRRSLSGPPFYKAPLKHAASNGISSLEGLRAESGFQKGEKHFDKAEGLLSAGFEESSQKGKQLAKPSKGRHRDSTSAVSGFDPAFEKRGLQEDAVPQFKDLQSISPANRNGDRMKSKWRDNVYDNMAPKDGLVDVTAIQLYKDWRNPCIRSTEPNILDLSSGVLGPNNKHLFPESISKEGLQKIQVLQQMDKKFIATVAERILVVIDQHAADERVRLEQLRKEVLEEKQHSSTLLDYPQELNISLGDQELLHIYKAQVEEWGWRFKYFKISTIGKNNVGNGLGRPHHGNSTALLTAVPNILGESLIKAKYLSEYLHQLATTDGTSAPPPAVLKVLASKACRGAIMFGDQLLRSECQQLVEGLKRTALSFQCAHGRPTLVPIVNLEALHLRFSKLHNKKRLADELDTPGVDGRKAWHGLRWHRSSLERAMERLKRTEM